MIRPSNYEKPEQQQKNISAAVVWMNSYESLVSWMRVHQMNFWKMRCSRVEQENQTLRDRMLRRKIKREKLNRIKAEDDEIDENFIKFLEISAKHRENLRREKEANDEYR